jgi:hypothetical protein
MTIVKALSLAYAKWPNRLCFASLPCKSDGLAQLYVGLGKVLPSAEPSCPWNSATDGYAKDFTLPCRKTRTLPITILYSTSCVVLTLVT